MKLLHPATSEVLRSAPDCWIGKFGFFRGRALERFWINITGKKYDSVAPRKVDLYKNSSHDGFTKGFLKEILIELVQIIFWRFLCLLSVERCSIKVRWKALILAHSTLGQTAKSHTLDDNFTAFSSVIDCSFLGVSGNVTRTQNTRLLLFFKNWLRIAQMVVETSFFKSGIFGSSHDFFCEKNFFSPHFA